MTAAAWIPVGLGVLSVLIIPALVILVRGAIKWTRTEDKLSVLVDDVRELIDEKDKVHAELLEQMRYDRDATDRRLRFVEEWFMRAGQSKLTP